MRSCVVASFPLGAGGARPRVEGAPRPPWSVRSGRPPGASAKKDPFAGGTPALDAMEPRGVRRRDVRMQARGPGDPSADHRWRVRPVGVHDDVHVPVGRHLDIEGGQAGATRDRATPPTTLTPHVSRRHGQCGTARRRPVPGVGVGPPVSVARAQGEHRRRAIPGLDLRRAAAGGDRSQRMSPLTNPGRFIDRRRRYVTRPTTMVVLRSNIPCLFCGRVDSVCAPPARLPSK